jgi:hypothetical protein
MIKACAFNCCVEHAFSSVQAVHTIGLADFGLSERVEAVDEPRRRAFGTYAYVGAASVSAMQAWP